MKNKLFLLSIFCLTANAALGGMFTGPARKTAQTGFRAVANTHKCPRRWPWAVATGLVGTGTGFLLGVQGTYPAALKEGFEAGRHVGQREMAFACLKGLKNQEQRLLRSKLQPGFTKDKGVSV